MTDLGAVLGSCHLAVHSSEPSMRGRERRSRRRRCVSSSAARWAAVCAASTRARAAAPIARGVVGESRRSPAPSSRSAGEQDLAARAEQRCRCPAQMSRDDRRAAGRGLEQPDAGADQPAAIMSARVTFRVKRLRVVEGGMIGGRQMLDPLDVGRPGDVGRILRPGDDEAQLAAARARARAAAAPASAGGRRCRCRDSRDPSAARARAAGRRRDRPSSRARARAGEP